jgi:dihydroorotate dehydrogenase (fumarate)
MSLATRYLGLDLDHPILPGASPLVDDPGSLRQLQDAGAPAIVMYSLFEEQVAAERFVDVYEPTLARAIEAGAGDGTFRAGPDRYLDGVRRARDATGLPIIGSLNGASLGGWTEYAALIEDAGASALELNVYELPGDPDVPGAEIEDRCVELVREVRGQVRIPLAVKLSPFYTALPALARRLADAGADALVLFNRFFEPDLDPDGRVATRRLTLSDPSELALRLRWIAILSGRVDLALSCSGGVDDAIDVVRALMAGATTVQTVSALMRHGPGHLATLRDGLDRWLEERGIDGLGAVRGCMDRTRIRDAAAYERANYVATLQQEPE